MPVTSMTLIMILRGFLPWLLTTQLCVKAVTDFFLYVGKTGKK